LWTAQVKGARTPLIAGGLVFVPTASGALYAFPIACGTGGKTCDPVWTAPGIDVQTSPPAVAGDRLFLASADGRLFAFALPNAAGSGAGARSSSAPTFVFYLGLVAAAAILLLVRRRRAS
jgi:outer membrane protein assembly factor BamB